MKKLSATQTLILAVVLLCIILSASVYFIDSCFFKAKGARLDQLGSYAGGIFGGMAFIIALYTLKLQRDQFTLSQENSQSDLITKEIDDVKSSIDNLLIRSIHSDYVGPDAIKKANHMTLASSVNSSFRDELIALMIRIENLAENLENSMLQTNTNNDLKTRLYQLFYSKVFWSAAVELWPSRNELERIHDDFYYFFPRYVRVCQLCYAHLVSQNIISPYKRYRLNVSEILNFDRRQYEVPDSEIDKMLKNFETENSYRPSVSGTGLDYQTKILFICKDMFVKGLIRYELFDKQTTNVHVIYIEDFGRLVLTAGGWIKWKEKEKLKGVQK